MPIVAYTAVPGTPFTHDGSVVGVPGTEAWHDADRALVANSTPATCSLDDANSAVLCIPFTKALPANATVLGIRVSIRRKTSPGSGGIEDQTITLARGANDGALVTIPGANNKARTGSPIGGVAYEAQAYPSNGATNDLWAVTAANLKSYLAATLTVAMQFLEVGSGPDEIDVDDVTMTVYCEVPGGSVLPTLMASGLLGALDA